MEAQELVAVPAPVLFPLAAPSSWHLPDSGRGAALARGVASPGKGRARPRSAGLAGGSGGAERLGAGRLSALALALDTLL